jgi:glycosyltransferase involved in cell wall biosynthesis
MSVRCAVIVPACNEEHVIGRTLSAMLDGADPGELEIVVVANGCDDRTAAAARAFEPAVRVVETPIASKALALDLGDRTAIAHPRLFVDADVTVDVSAIRAVADALDVEMARAAAPQLHVDVAGRPWSVRAYYRIWSRLAFARAGALGSGFYGISAAGRARFDRFPELIADDLFVPGLFAASERLVLRDHVFVQPAPRDRRSLVTRRVRAAAGTLQYGAQFPIAHAELVGSGRGALLAIAARPWLWPAALAYASVRAQAQLGAHRKVRRGLLTSWERDESTRAPEVAR